MKLFPSTGSSALLAALCCLSAWAVAAADVQPPGPQVFKYRVLGLFAPNRQDDFREVMKEIPEITVEEIDFETSEANFKFDPLVAFPTVKQDKYIERFDNRVRTITRGMFGIRAVCEIPRDKLKFVEIPVVGLDCQGCSLAAYEAINKMEGVEQATASFKEGRVTAWIDPAKTDREALEAALKKKNVQLTAPAN